LALSYIIVDLSKVKSKGVYLALLKSQLHSSSKNLLICNFGGLSSCMQNLPKFLYALTHPN